MTKRIDPLPSPRTLPDVCVRCATCMTVCPVARVTPRFPGPKQAGPGAQRFRVSSGVSVDDWIDLCMGCHLCDTACPAGVPVSEMNLRAKAKFHEERGRPLRDWLLVRSDRFGEWAARFSRVVNPLLESRTLRRLLDLLLGIDRRCDLPRYEYPTFRRWFRERPRDSRFRERPEIAYFHGCFTNTNEVDVGKAVVVLLEAHGFSVTLPPQRCCGMPRLGVGDLRGAKAMGQRNLSLLLPTVRRGLEMVFSSTSCGLMLRHEYARLFRLPDAEALAVRLFDVSEFLLRLAEEGREAPNWTSQPLRVGYFVPCHLRSLNIGLPALELLRRVPDLEVHLIDAECCGLGGLYGLKKEHFAISREIGRDVALEVARMKPALILSDCEGCRMQLRRLTGLPALHPVQLLRDALDGP